MKRAKITARKIIKDLNLAKVEGVPIATPIWYDVSGSRRSVQTPTPYCYMVLVPLYPLDLNGCNIEYYASLIAKQYGGIK